MLRLLTLDILGIAALLVVAIGAAFGHFFRRGCSLAFLRQNGPYILIAFSILDWLRTASGLCGQS